MTVPPPRLSPDAPGSSSSSPSNVKATKYGRGKSKRYTVHLVSIKGMHKVRLNEMPLQPPPQAQLRLLDPRQLPVELVYRIAYRLDNRSLLQWGIASKWFLRSIVPTLDPRHQVRLQLKKACAESEHVQFLLRARYTKSRRLIRGMHFFQLPVLMALLDFVQFDQYSPLHTNTLVLHRPPADVVQLFWLLRDHKLFRNRPSGPPLGLYLDFSALLARYPGSEKFLLVLAGSTNIVWGAGFHKDAKQSEAVCNALAANHSLRTLRFSGMTDTGEEAEQARTKLGKVVSKLVYLEELDCNEVHWPVEALCALFSSRLWCVSLVDCNIGVHAQDFLSGLGSSATQLEVLHIEDDLSGSPVVFHLCRALKQNSTLRALSLKECNMAGEVHHIADLLMSPLQNVEELSLNRNDPSTDAFSALARALAHPNSRLKYLYLESTFINALAAKTFCCVLSMKHLRLEYLDLGELVEFDIAVTFVELAEQLGIVQALWKNSIDVDICITIRRSTVPLVIKFSVHSHFKDQLVGRYSVFRRALQESDEDFPEPSTRIRAFIK